MALGSSDYTDKKQLLNAEMNFWRRSAGTTEMLKIRKGVIRKK